MFKPFFRKPNPWALTKGAVQDLEALVQQPGYKVWKELLERAAVSDVATLGRAGQDPKDVFAASERLGVWQRCHTLVENLINTQEAVNDFTRQRHNGVAGDPGKHWGNPSFW